MTNINRFNFFLNSNFSAKFQDSVTGIDYITWSLIEHLGHPNNIVTTLKPIHNLTIHFMNTEKTYLAS